MQLKLLSNPINAFTSLYTRENKIEIKELIT